MTLQTLDHLVFFSPLCWTASRLGRRPKRLKEVGGGEGSGGARAHVGNLPITPYPSPQELYKLRMAELQKILQTNGTFKAELMQAFLSAAKASFQEHSKSGGSGEGGDPKSLAGQQQQQQQQMMELSGLVGLNQSLLTSTTGAMTTTSSTSDMPCASSTDSVGMSAGGGAGGLSGVDSPSSLNSPGGSMIDFSNLAALDNFLFEQGMPATPGGGQSNPLEVVGELQPLNSPFNLNNVSLDPVSAATSPLSDLGVGSPPLALPPQSSASSSATAAMTNGGRGSFVGGGESLSLHDGGGLNSVNLLNVNMNAPSTSSATSPPPPPHQYQQQYQQYQQQQQQQPLPSPSLLSPSFGHVQVKTEPANASCFSSPVGSVKAEVKTEPVSPEPMPGGAQLSMMSPASAGDENAYETPEVDVNGIMDDVRQIPSETRRLLIEQVKEGPLSSQSVHSLFQRN